MGYEIPVVDQASWYDDENGYVGEHYLAKKFDPPQKCERCGKIAAWAAGGDESHSYLCLQCADEWSEYTPTIPGFHEGRMSKKKWFDGFNSFLATKPRVLNLEEHNRMVLTEFEYIRGSLKVANPELYKEWFPGK